MRSKTVSCMNCNDKAQATRGEGFVSIHAPEGEGPRVVLAPHRARQLGKALIQMADEVEEKR